MVVLNRRTAFRIIGLTALAVVGCGSQPPPDITASDVMQKASDALKKVKAAHFKLTSTGGMMSIGTGLVAKSIEGDVVQPDRLKGTAVSTFGKLTVEIGFVIVGAQQYITNPITKQWQPLPASTAAPNLLDPDHGAPVLLKQVSNLKKLANQSLDGVDCYHVSGDVPTSLVASLVGAAGTTGNLAGDIWVGTSDFLPRQIQLNGAVTTDEPPQIQRLLVLSAFDETITIAAPV